STDTALEAAISARSTGGEKPHAEELALSGAQRPGLPDDEIEALIATRRRSRKEKSAGFCPQCGRAAQKSDKFCSKCGATLI
ncbi:MAG: zinc-ribbon domain-containing protein, partial [Anaerolineales bacterium]